MIDDKTKGALLCRAIRVLAYFDVALVITSTAGRAYHFEMEGEPALETEVIVRAAMLDATFFNARQDGRFDRFHQDVSLDQRAYTPGAGIEPVVTSMFQAHRMP